MEQELLKALAAWSAAGAGLVGATAVLARRLSRDRTEMVKDRAESRFVEQMHADRAEAMQAWREAAAARKADAEAIARLTAENESQARDLARLAAEFAAFKRLVSRHAPELTRYLASDFQRLTPNMPPLPPP